MEAAKHAPGPWHVAEWEVRDKDGAVETGGWQVVGADGYAINTCISEGDGEQEEANLHFIVKAVNSHEQLVAALRAALRELGDYGRPCVNADIRAALAAAGAA